MDVPRDLRRQWKWQIRQSPQLPLLTTAMSPKRVTALVNLTMTTSIKSVVVPKTLTTSTRRKPKDCDMPCRLLTAMPSRTSPRTPLGQVHHVILATQPRTKPPARSCECKGNIMYNMLSIKDAYLFIFVSLAYYRLTTRIYATTTYLAYGPLVSKTLHIFTSCPLTRSCV
jgi:hypothetical protein